MSGSRKILIVSGVLIAIWGMCFGLYYAVFAEHQALDKIGGSLAAGFISGANGDLVEARGSIQTYADTQFDYVRAVDVHSHWIGLAMLLIVFGVTFERVRFSEQGRKSLAWIMVSGAVVFPLGVILQTFDRGVIPKAVAGIGAVLVTIALAAIAFGFARSERNS
jgi:Kef-type K+ transport system membrane component KefB